jgi:hypothetical protein
MAISNRVFISFAIEDANLRTLLVGQCKNENIPFSFVDMSVKEAWEDSWKTKCRIKIKGCDGIIGIITKNTLKADGQLWELKCASEEGVPIFLMYGNDDRPVNFSESVKGCRIFNWSWPNISTFINNL